MKALQTTKQMKRINGLFEQLVDIHNIERAYKNAKKGKNHYREVQKVEKNRDKYLSKFREMLIHNTFQTGKYEIFKRTTGNKDRIIYKLPFFPDRILHHAIVQVMKPYWMRLLIRDTFSTIPGRGIHDGVKRVKKALKNRNETRYCLKLDIKKFFPNIDHDILKTILRKKIKDARFLAVLDEIVDSAPGIPIGNYISQWFSNLYLAYFDHYVKETLHCKYYFRYADDIIILSRTKAHLHDIKQEIERYLYSELKLTIKNNWQIFPVSARGIDFLGYKFFHTHTLVRKSIKQNFKKTIKNKTTKQKSPSYWGWFAHADTYNLRKKYFDYAQI